MSTALVPESEILQYIPQRAPIVMVSEILHCDSTGIKTVLNITDANIFVANGQLQESGMIENIAQSAAAMTGYFAKTSNSPVKRGFIGSVKKLVINDLPKVDLPIFTDITIVTEVMNATVIEGIIRQNDVVMAQCEMNIFLEE